jgi:hypothetical protein
MCWRTCYHWLKETTSCVAIWCECFHHRASCPSSERYWKGCWPSARNDATSRQGYSSLKNASVGEAFPRTSVYTTSTVWTKKSEPRLICEKDPSPLPHWKLSGTMCHQPSHTTCATCTSERKTNVRSTSSQTKLAQSVSHSLGYCIAKARLKETTSCVAIWCECFHHRASCPSSERYWKGCRLSASNDATSK